MGRIYGDIIQNGYVVEDLEAAAMQWVRTMGVGPFFFVEDIEFREIWYRGEPSDLRMSTAIAYSGDLQIELVQQHNDADSIYQDFLTSVGEGLQHVGALTDDLDTQIESAGMGDQRIQWGTTAAGQRFAYLGTDFHRGCMLELIEADAEMASAFAYMKKTAAEWDGSRPLRGRS